MIYVIGAVTDMDALNRQAFEAVRDAVRETHPAEDVVIPHDHIPADATWQEAMRASIRKLTEADVVCVVQQPQLATSRGYQLESLIAKALNMPRLFINPDVGGGSQ